MANPEWGAKRQCAECGERFYDLNRDPVTCPECGASFELAVLAGQRRPRVAAPASAKDQVDADEDALAEEDDGDDVLVEDDDEGGDDALPDADLDSDENDEDEDDDSLLPPEDDDEDDDLGDLSGGMSKDDDS